MATVNKSLTKDRAEALEPQGRQDETELTGKLNPTNGTLSVPLVHVENKGEIILTNTDVAMTDQDRQDFLRLDKRFGSAQRESISALKEIRKRQLYRETYSSFDAYMATRGHTRQWATQQIQWLRRQELLDELESKQHGKASYQLTVEEAQKLGQLEPPDENEGEDEYDEDLYAHLYVGAVAEAQAEADAVGKKRTADMVKRAVEKRVNYLSNMDEYGHDLTLDESVQIDRLPFNHDAEALLESARVGASKEGRPVADCLKELVDPIVEAERQRQEENRLLAEQLKAERKAIILRQKREAAKRKKREKEAEKPAELSNDVENETDENLLFAITLTGDFATDEESNRLSLDDLASMLAVFSDSDFLRNLKAGEIKVKLIPSQTGESKE